MKKVLYLSLLIVCSLVTVIAKAETKTNYRNALIFAYSPVNSFYEDDNIRLEIYNEQLWAINKTTKTIFIDLSQSFAYHNGASMPLFDGDDKKQGDKKASKKNVSTKDDVYISIAPSMGATQHDTYICTMSLKIYGTYTTTEPPYGDFTEYDKRLLTVVDELLTESLSADPKGKAYVGTVSRHLTEDESVNNIGVSLAYAFNKKAEEWTNVSISTWVSDVIFTPYYVEMPEDLGKNEKKGFGVKETKPAMIHLKANSPFEFDKDKSPLIVCDWEGNYKKGEFTLSMIHIQKTKKNLFKLVGGALLTGFTGGLGAAVMLTAFEDVFYKDMLSFDGRADDWGKLTYEKGGFSKTKQTK